LRAKTAKCVQASRKANLVSSRKQGNRKEKTKTTNLERGNHLWGSKAKKITPPEKRRAYGGNSKGHLQQPGEIVQTGQKTKTRSKTAEKKNARPRRYQKTETTTRPNPSSKNPQLKKRKGGSPPRQTQNDQWDDTERKGKVTRSTI